MGIRFWWISTFNSERAGQRRVRGKEGGSPETTGKAGVPSKFRPPKGKTG